MNEVKKMTEKNTYVNAYGETMENIKALTIIGQGKYKTIRLRQNAFDRELLTLLGEEEQQRYMINSTYRYPDGFNTAQIERNHILAELHYLMDKSGITEFWRSKDIMMDFKKGVFINDRLIKSLYSSKAITQSGRGYGALIYPKACHTIYYYENNASYWSSESERRHCNISEKYIREHFAEFKDVDKHVFKNALLVSCDNQVAYDLLNNRSHKAKKGLKIDGTFDNFRYTNKNHITETLFILENEEVIKNILKKKMFVKNTEESRIDSDGVTEDGKHWLFTFDFNLTRIRRIKKAADHFDQKKFVVYGFNWQKDFLNRYFNNKNVETYTVDIKKLIEILGINI